MPYITKISKDYRPRIYYPLASVIGILLLYGIGGGLIGLKLKKRINSIFIAIPIMLFTVQCFSFGQIFVNRYVTNCEDQVLSEIIGQKISEYEEMTGKSIQYVTFYEDGERTKYRDRQWRLSERAYSADWSRLPVLNYYLKTNYLKGEISKNLEESFVQKDWKVYSDKQIVFRDDTVHICVY